MMKRNKKSRPVAPQFTAVPKSATPPFVAPDVPGAKPRYDGWTPDKRVRFLEMLAGRWSVEKAATEVGMSERAAYALRARDPDFAESWAKAREIVRQALIDESVRLASFGRITRIYEDGRLVAQRKRQSAALVLGAVKRLRSKKLLGDPTTIAAAQDFKNCMLLLELGLPYPDPEAKEPVGYHLPPPHDGRGWTPATQRLFCEALSELGDVNKACESIGKSRSVAYGMRNAKGCEAFAIAWNAAQLVASERLVELAMELARDGTIEEESRFNKPVRQRRITCPQAQQVTAERVAELKLPVVRMKLLVDPNEDGTVRVELTPLAVEVVVPAEVETEPVLQAA